MNWTRWYKCLCIRSTVLVLLMVTSLWLAAPSAMTAEDPRSLAPWLLRNLSQVPGGGPHLYNQTYGCYNSTNAHFQSWLQQVEAVAAAYGLRPSWSALFADGAYHIGFTADPAPLLGGFMMRYTWPAYQQWRHWRLVGPVKG